MARRIRWTLLALGGLLLLWGLGVRLDLVDGPAWLRSAEEPGRGEMRDLSSEGTEPGATPARLLGLPSRLDASCEDPRIGDPVDLDAVDRERDLHGVVVRRDGSPVAGARLQVVTYPWRYQRVLTDGLHDEVEEGPVTHSASDGTFRIRLERGALVALRVEAAGLAPRELDLRQAGEQVRVVLPEPARLRVVVRGPDGVGVPETQIRLFQLGGGGRTVNGVTGAEGVCVFADLEPKRSVVLDLAPPRHGHPGWVRAAVPEEGEETVEVVLVAGRTLRGMVTDAKTLEPIPGARVGMNWVLRPETQADATGQYELPGWTGEGVRDVCAVAPGYARVSRIVGEEDVIDIALRRGHAVVGRIVDPAGQVVAGAQVAAVGSEFTGRGQQRASFAAGRAGPDGLFRLDGLDFDLAHTLVVAAPGLGRTLVDFDAQAATDAVVDLGDVALPKGLRIAGVVVDDAGDPVADVPLRLTGANDDRAVRRNGVVAQTIYGNRLERTTDDLGRFVFPDLSAGRYTIAAEPKAAPRVEQDVRLEAGDLLGVRLTLAATREVVIRVEDETRSPVAGVFVSVQGAHGSQRTDGDGVARLRVPPRAAQVQVSPYDNEGLLPAPALTLDEHQAELLVVLRRAAVVAGRLETDDGKPIPRAQVRALRDGETVGWAVTDEGGRFRCKLEPGSNVDLSFDGRTGSREDASFQDLEARLEAVVPGTGGAVLVARPIVADRVLEILVLDPEGRAAAGVSLNAFAGGSFHWQGTTDDAGRCRVPGLRAEPIQVHVTRAWTPERPWILPEVQTVSAEAERVVLQLQRAHVLRGRFAVQGEVSSPWIRVEILRSNGSKITDLGVRADGPFTLPVAEAEQGPLTVLATTGPPDNLSGRLDGVVPPAEGLLIELRAP